MERAGVSKRSMAASRSRHTCDSFNQATRAGVESVVLEAVDHLMDNDTFYLGWCDGWRERLDIVKRKVNLLVLI